MAIRFNSPPGDLRILPLRPLYNRIFNRLVEERNAISLPKLISLLTWRLDAVMCALEPIVTPAHQQVTNGAHDDPW
jgi:hypothetical protein